MNKWVCAQLHTYMIPYVFMHLIEQEENENNMKIGNILAISSQLKHIHRNMPT